MIGSLWPYMNPKLEELWTCNWQQKKGHFKHHRWGNNYIAWMSISEITASGTKSVISNWLLIFFFRKRWLFSRTILNAFDQRYDQMYKTKVSGNGLKYTWLVYFGNKFIITEVIDQEVVAHFIFHFQMIFEKSLWSLWLCLSQKVWELWTCDWQQKKAQIKHYEWADTHTPWISISEIIASGPKSVISNWLLKIFFSKLWLFSGTNFNGIYQRYNQIYKTKVSGNGLKYIWLHFYENWSTNADVIVLEVVAHFFCVTL